MKRSETKNEVNTLGYLLNMIERYKLLIDHPMQRKAGQWDSKTKSELVSSVLNGEDISNIAICSEDRNGCNYEWLVDGLQRITILCDYKNDMFKIGKEIDLPMIEYQTVVKDEDGKRVNKLEVFDIRNKRYSDLPVEIKDLFTEYQMQVVRHLHCDDEIIAHHMRRYNAGKAMNGAQLAITRAPEIASKVKAISSSKLFLNNFSNSAVKGGKLEQVVMETIMLIFHADSWKKGGAKVGEMLNEKANASEFDTLAVEVNRLNDVVVARDKDFSHLFTLKDANLWLAVFHDFCKLGIADGRFVDFLDSMEDVDIDALTGVDCRASKDKAVVTAKVAAVLEKMNEFFADEIAENDSKANNEHFEKIVAAMEAVSDNPIEDSRKVVESLCGENEVTEERLEDIVLYIEMLNDYTMNNDILPENAARNILIIAESMANDENEEETIKKLVA